MPSELTFSATKKFRNDLVSRNLKPYNVPGNFAPNAEPQNYETIQRDLGVVDSDGRLISDSPFSDRLYPKNAYGPDGGYDKSIKYNNVIIKDKVNLGPYDYSDTKLDRGSQDTFIKDSTLINLYMNPLLKDGTTETARYSVPATPVVTKLYNSQRNQTYPNFNLSNTYSPYNILFGQDKTLLSQDSALQQIAAISLKKNLEDRIAREIEQRTILRNNLAPALSDPVLATQIASGKVPAFEGNYQITRPANPVTAVIDLKYKLQGVTIPVNLIPGSYFLGDQNIQPATRQITSAFNTGLSALGGLVGLNLNSLEPTPSQIFINNTGSWTRRRLFYNLDFNKYKPFYSRGLVDDVVQTIGRAVSNVFGTENQGNAYLPSLTRNPSRAQSPAGSIPTDAWGREVITNVYGAETLAKDFEALNFNFGLAGKSSTDGDGSIEGGFVWTSRKYKDNAGFNVKPGGDIGSEDPIFPQISSRYDQNASSDRNFRNDTLLDKTQRIVNSQPGGKRRLSHAGNAIDQVSKVFNDGYKEITKGSKVKSYLNDEGEAIINSKKVVSQNEYCRLFTKDTPYYTYGNLQKKDRLYRSIEGLSTYSILDNVYNLNIAPTESNYSKAGFAGDEGRFVKKYMFSIENLAWRTSSRPGYRVSDLPSCEIGPNGGRIMWFPPYNISFSEQVNPQWNPTTFLGRPEPVYTYKDTQRTGTLSFTVVVDHPSVLNLIVNKYLEKEDPQKVNDIVDSFFAGCLKYDLYELAKIYNTIPPNKLVYLQQILGQPVVTYEDGVEAIDEIPTEQPTQVVDPPDVSFSEFDQLGFHFFNAIPNTGANPAVPFSTYFNTYKTTIASSKLPLSSQTFFDNVALNNFEFIDKNKQFVRKIIKSLEEDTGANMQITLLGQASSPGEVDYNTALGQRRINAVKSYLLEPVDGKSIKQFIDSGRLKIKEEPKGETSAVPITTATDTDKKKYLSFDIDCAKNLPQGQKVKSVPAIACRRVLMTINYQKGEKTPPPTTTPRPTPSKVPIVTIPRQEVTDFRGFTKRLIRFLLSECDYFKMVQQETPFIYNSMKEKIKYFHPTFHSTTPEGLNARLTFLQQCTRPGDTIPTISTDGSLLNNDAYNTAFGSPPVLVLRIGDFFHTKVLCTSLGIQYEPLNLDLNPEGIGVQPMLAKISLGLNFIGGSGLKEPIEQLQNALSFNYYANTEIYDDRAESTEDTLAFDERFYEEVVNYLRTQTPPKADNVKAEEGGEAIGTLKQITATGGTINYKTIMNKLLTQSNTYYVNTYNKLREVVDNYNYGVLQVYNFKRSYQDGEFFEFTSKDDVKTKIFGRSIEYQKKIEEAYKRLVEKINSGDLPIQKELDRVKSIKKEDQILFKDRLTNYLNIKIYDDFINKMTLVDQEMSKEQLNFIQTISKINYVMTDRDGKVSKEGSPTVYKITADTKVINQFKTDYKNIASGLTSFIEGLSKDKIITKSKDYDGPDDFVVLIGNSKGVKIEGTRDTVKFGDNNEKNFYLFFAQTIIKEDTLQDLIDYLTKNPQSVSTQTPEASRVRDFDTYKKTVTNCLTARASLYKQEQQAIVDIFEKNQSKYTTPSKPYSDNVEREYQYEVFPSPSNDDKDRLLNILYIEGNSNQSQNTFNGKKIFN